MFRFPPLTSPKLILARLLLNRLSPVAVVVAIVVFLLLGCSSNPSFTEGEAQLKVQTEVAKMDIIKANIGSLRSSVIDIPPYLKEDPPTLPPSELDALKAYLDSNKCKGEVVEKKCHYATVVYSIEMANRADANSEELFGAKTTVHNLLRTINRIYDILGDQPPDPEK